MRRKLHKFGRVPDKVDHRDHLYRAIIPALKTTYLFNKYTGKFTPPVYDQGQLGSCVSNAVADLVSYHRINENDKPEFWTPSRLFNYYYSRAKEGSIKFDVGCSVRDGVKTTNKEGVPLETLWPYKIDNFAEEPSKEAIEAGTKYKSTEYLKVDGTSIEQINAALLEDHPIVFGFTVFESFETLEVAKTGIVPMPKPGEMVLGGHAVVIVGINIEGEYLYCRNSWGKGWGKEGYFHMPFKYATDPKLANDFWIIKSMNQS